MSNRSAPTAFDQITDPIDRALVKEWAHLAAIHDRLVETSKELPHLDRLALSVELNDWMAKNSHLSAEQKLRKLDEFKKRADAIDRRIKRWHKRDILRSLDEEFECKRQMDAIEAFRFTRAWRDRVPAAVALGQFRGAIKASEAQLAAFSRHFAPRKERISNG